MKAVVPVKHISQILLAFFTFSNQLFIYIFLQWLICLSYLLPAFSSALSATYGVTGLPHYQGKRGLVDTGNQSSEDYGLQLNEDQGATFGMFEIGGFDFHFIEPDKKARKYLWIQKVVLLPSSSASIAADLECQK